MTITLSAKENAILVAFNQAYHDDCTLNHLRFSDSGWRIADHISFGTDADLFPLFECGLLQCAETEESHLIIYRISTKGFVALNEFIQSFDPQSKKA